jgi:hypothetical protein
MPQPGQEMPVNALKGQKNGMAPPILSAEKIPVTCNTVIEKRMQAKTMASLLGIRQRSI